MHTRLWLCLTLLTAPAFGAEVLVLGFVDYPPYSRPSPEGAQGLAFDRLIPLFRELGFELRPLLQPTYARAVLSLREGRIDGLVPASRHPERDAVAEFSRPLFPNSWVWVLRPRSLHRSPGAVFGSDTALASNRPPGPLGALLGSNQYSWMLEQGFGDVQGLSDLSAGLRMVREGRLGAVLTARGVAEALTPDPGALEFIHHSDRPLGLYLSRRFLNRHPGLMNRLNARLPPLSLPGARE